jgi:hypothetical protein
MARETECGEHKDGASMDVEGAERLDEKWRWRKE